MQLELHQQKALELLLKEMFLMEQVGKYGASAAFVKHPPKSWFNWLYKNGLISKEHLENQLESNNKSKV